jgi:hypothetical protein
VTPCYARNCSKIPTTLYDSVLTLDLPLVTFTPSCFALVMMSMRFLAETEWEILEGG